MSSTHLASRRRPSLASSSSSLSSSSSIDDDEHARNSDDEEEDALSSASHRLSHQSALPREGEERLLKEYSHAKRSRRKHEEEDSGSSESSGDASEEEEETPKKKKKSWVRWIIFGIVLLLLIGGGIFAYVKLGPTLQSGTTATSPATVETADTAANTLPVGTGASPTTTQTPTGGAATNTPTAESNNTSLTGGLGVTTTPIHATNGTTTTKKDDGTTGDDPKQTTTLPKNDKITVATDKVTLAGSYADPASYTAGFVEGPTSTVQLGQDFTWPKATQAATKGEIYVGEISWYYAGDAGYGSCGLKLYDGQPIYFAALSLYQWMGAPGPSTHCFECVEIQSLSSGKTIQAIVLDSCQACNFGHVDLEQAAYLELATIAEGLHEVAWEFIDCPASFALDKIKALSSSDYVPIKQTD